MSDPVSADPDLEVTLPPGMPAHLRDAWESAGDDVERAIALYEIAEWVERRSRWQAVDYAESARRYAERSGDLPTLVRATNLVAFLLNVSNKTADALRYVFEGVRLARQIQESHPHIYMRMLSTRGTIRATVGDEAGARRDYEAVLALPGEEVDHATAIPATVNLGWLAADMGRPHTALHHVERAGELLSAVTLQQQREPRSEYSDTRLAYFRQAILMVRGLALTTSAEQLLAKGQHETMREVCDEAGLVCDSILGDADEDDTFASMMVASLRSVVARVRGDADEAIAQADTAVLFARRMGQTIYPYAWIAEGRAHAARGDLVQAVGSWNEVLSIARRANRYRHMQLALTELALLHEEQGDTAAALRMTREALRLATLANLNLNELHDLDAAARIRPGRAEDAADWLDRLRLAEEQAQHDPLTGLLNRRGVQEGLPTLEEQAEQGGLVQLVAFIDIDFFKAVNDRYSHAVGDRVLRHVANLCADHVPHNAILGRHGGEEFVLVANVADIETGHAMLDGVRRVIAATDWSGLLPGRTLTVSIGFAPRAGRTFSETLAAADANLYNAKREGRNRVHPFPQHGGMTIG